MKRALPLLLTLSLLAGCSAETARSLPSPGASLPPVQIPTCTSEGLTNGYSAFAVELLRANRTEGENALLSPLSVTLALGMTANGAEGDTLQAFEALFGLDRDTLNGLCALFMSDYASLGGSTQATLANSLWCDPSLTLSDPFTRRCTDTYLAQLFRSDLQDPATVQAVNDWASEATQGLIPSVVDHFDQNTLLALVNAVYLKNQFSNPFETPASDWELPFTAADGTVSHPKGMHNGTRNEQYIAAENARGVVLPYDDGRLALLLMLPDEGVSLTDYLSGWDGATIPTLLSCQKEGLVSLSMPKFNAEWGGSLKDSLSAMGLGAAFQAQQADFTAMTGDTPLYIGDVIHKTAFSVNEKGTEAAAVTAVMMDTNACMPPEDLITLTFDRPFLYGIVDLSRGIPLFLGTVEELY